MNTRLPLQSRLRLIVLTCWLVLAAAVCGSMLVIGLTPIDTVRRMVVLLRSPLGRLLFIIGFGLRPFVFFPASLITLVGGVVYGPVGIVYVLIGANLSSIVAYAIGRWFEAGAWRTVLATNRLNYYVNQIQHNSFETVLIGRFLPIPLELDTYVAGLLRIDLRAYLLACALASIPGTIPFVLAGASVPLDMQGSTLTPRFEPKTLVLSIVVLSISLIVARLLRRHEATRRRGDEAMR